MLVNGHHQPAFYPSRFAAMPQLEPTHPRVLNTAIKPKNELASRPRRPMFVENECGAKAILPNRSQP